MIQKTTEVVLDAICNMCGKSCLGKLGNLCGVSIRCQGVYDSPRLVDGSVHQFELCEECLLGIVEKLKIPPASRDDRFYL